MEHAISDFFKVYQNAQCVHEVAGQLFHNNAKEAADARAAYYGLTVVTHQNPKNAPAPVEPVVPVEPIAPVEPVVPIEPVEPISPIIENKVKKGKNKA